MMLADRSSRGVMQAMLTLAVVLIAVVRIGYGIWVELEKLLKELGQ